VASRLVVEGAVVTLRSAAPRSVQLAGVLVGLQGLAGVVFAVAVLVHAITSAGRSASAEYAEVVFFLVLAAGVLAVAAGLLRGQPWTRTPAALLQILLLGVTWYVLGPSGQVLAGILVAVFCLVTLVLLFTTRARVWAAREYTGQ
jgi:hypothetical protein